MLEGKTVWRAIIQISILHDVLFFNFPIDREQGPNGLYSSNGHSGIVGNPLVAKPS